MVLGQREIVASLQDVAPEQDYDEDRVASYDAGTVGDLLDQIHSENGDDQPSLLVNGQPVRDLGDVADLPVEAIRRVEQLPRGSAQRIGGSAGQRAYNIVLQSRVRSATMTLSRQEASDGEWGVSRGEALLTFIKGQDRLNLTLRGSDSDLLLESDRDLVPREELYPYSALGNVIPIAGAEIDPVLSARAGQPVTTVALSGNPAPNFGDLLAGANRLNPSDAARYRSIRSASRAYEAALAGGTALTSQLSLSFNGRLSWSESRSLRGLPSARFLVPPTNAYTPFSTAVLVALSDPAQPLESNSDSNSKSLAVTLHGNFGRWHTNVVARHDDRDSTYLSELNGSFAGGYYTIPNTTDPFAGTLGPLIPVTQSISTSHNVNSEISTDAEGPVLELPAGPLLARLSVGAASISYDATDVSGSRSFERRELTGQLGVTIPLTGEKFLSQVGHAELALDAGRLDLGRYGTIARHTIAFNWSLRTWLRLTASEAKSGTAIQPELLSAPAVVYENTPYFDPLRDETVYVRLIAGGTLNLANQTQRTRTLSVTAIPLPKYKLQLNADYQELELRNVVGGLPTPSAAIVAAFPNRFLRDPTGRLVQVDATSVNFDRQRTRQLRLGVNFQVPITPARMIPRTSTTPAQRIAGANLQVSLSHTHLFDSTTVIRAGLPEVDLLSGGAIGIGAAQQRDYTTGSLALTRGVSGLRLNANWRGPSYLVTGTTAAPDRLTFRALLRLDFRAFLDLGQLMPNERGARNTRLSLVFENILNERQRVTNSLGLSPQAYQPPYRDPVGRTVMVELRKVL